LKETRVTVGVCARDYQGLTRDPNPKNIKGEFSYAIQSIDAAISSADLQAVRDAFAAILRKLPFLVTLTAAERRTVFKAGPDSLSFVESAQVAKNNPAILPAGFNSAGFKKDVELFAVLTELNSLAASVASQIDDTRDGRRQRSDARRESGLQIRANWSQNNRRFETCSRSVGRTLQESR